MNNRKQNLLQVQTFAFGEQLVLAMSSHFSKGILDINKDFTFVVALVCSLASWSPMGSLITVHMERSEY